MDGPFPSLHVAANEEATARAEGARALAAQAAGFLTDLDRLLDEVA